MTELPDKILRLSAKTDSRAKKRRSKSTGQSLVELALTLPVLLFLFSGLVEFGFMLNYYLSLLDATRYAARYYSNATPFNPDSSDDMNFYAGAAAMTKDQLEPRSVTDNTRKIVLDSSIDDVIVTVYGVSGSSVTTYPTSGAYHMYNNQTSVFTTAKLQGLLVSGAPCEGMLLVEVDYNYHQVLALPWMAWLGNPILMQAYTIMPLEAAEPTC